MAKNLCLAANGGTLGSGANEADRDNNWNVVSHMASNGEATTATILFASPSTIEYVRYKTMGSQQGGGSGSIYYTLSLIIDGTDTVLISLTAGPGGGWDTGETTYNTGGPWKKATGIKTYVACQGAPADKYSRTYETQAWGNSGEGHYSQII
jgi:hypothetical protein